MSTTCCTTTETSVSKSANNERDIEAISSVIQTYAQGGRKGDAAIMKPAFREDEPRSVVMTGVDAGVAFSIARLTWPDESNTVGCRGKMAGGRGAEHPRTHDRYVETLPFAMNPWSTASLACAWQQPHPRCESRQVSEERSPGERYRRGFEG